MSLKGIIALATLPVPLMASLFWHWQVYALYRSLGDRVRSMGYYLFSFRFANPYLARQSLGYEDIVDSLPTDLAARFMIVRRQTRFAARIVAAWALLCFLLIGLSSGR